MGKRSPKDFASQSTVAEVVHLRTEDVVTQTGLCWELKVRCQKNNPNGLGQVCVIPRIRALGVHSPVRVLQQWLERRQVLSQSCMLSDYLFVTITGRAKGGQVSPDCMREHVAYRFGRGEHRILCVAAERSITLDAAQMKMPPGSRAAGALPKS